MPVALAVSCLYLLYVIRWDCVCHPAPHVLFPLCYGCGQSVHSVFTSSFLLSSLPLVFSVLCFALWFPLRLLHTLSPWLPQLSANFLRAPVVNTPKQICPWKDYYVDIERNCSLANAPFSQRRANVERDHKSYLFQLKINLAVWSISLSHFYKNFWVTYQFISLSQSEKLLVYDHSQTTAAGREGESFLSPMGGNQRKDREADREPAGQ